MGKKRRGGDNTPLNYQYGDSDCFPTSLLNAFLTVLDDDESIPADVIRKVWIGSMDRSENNGRTVTTSRKAVKALCESLDGFVPAQEDGNGHSPCPVSLTTYGFPRQEPFPLDGAQRLLEERAVVLRIVCKAGKARSGHYVLLSPPLHCRPLDGRVHLFDPLVGVDKTHELMWTDNHAWVLPGKTHNLSVPLDLLNEMRNGLDGKNKTAYPIAVVVSRGTK